MIVSEATRCRSIMRGLLDFARQSRVVKTPTDVGLLVRDVVDTMGMSLSAGTVTLRTEIEPALPILLLDGGQVRQMLVNPVQNGITSGERENPRVAWLRGFRPGDLLVLRV
jgi:signal transduction histidine kinase